MSTDTTTITNPPEPASTRRADPPVSVYVRIRPFIGDELARGEDQNMLCPRGEKSIAVKLYPTATTIFDRPKHPTMNTRWVILLGRIDCISQPRWHAYSINNVHNKNSSNKFSSNPLMKSSLVRIGYCAHSVWRTAVRFQPTKTRFISVAFLGKTHTMFGTPKDPGLIPQCLQRIFLHVGYNIDSKVLYKPDGLENLVQTNMNNLQDEINYRKYIFKDDKDDYVSRPRRENLAI